MRNREVAQAGKDIAAETGLEHRPAADGQRVAGIYRRSVMLASGRYAMLDDGMGFSLVPWKPVIEQRLGQQIAATVRGGGVSWKLTAAWAVPRLVRPTPTIPQNGFNDPLLEHHRGTSTRGIETQTLGAFGRDLPAIR